MLEWIKDHPYITAGGVFVVGLVVVFGMQGGSTETVEAAGINYAPAVDNQLSQANVAAQVASKQIEAEKAAALGAQDTAYKIEKIKFEQAHNANVLTAGVQTLQITESNITQRASDVLAARVAETQLSTQKAIAQIGANRDTTIAGYQRDVSLATSLHAANVAVHTLNVQGRQNEINQLGETQRAQISADTTRHLASLIAGGANARLLN